MGIGFNILDSSDGPTSVFMAGQLGVSWINTFGLIIVVLMLLPNIIYASKIRGQKSNCDNKLMIILEQIGRYASMFLMIFNIGIAEFGFNSVGAFLIYGIGTIILLLAYWTMWLLYSVNKVPWKNMCLAVIPTLIFLISGITLRHILLIISAVLFGVGHIYITYQNMHY